MLFSRLICIIFAFALADLAAGSLPGTPLLRWTAIGTTVLYLAILALTMRRAAPFAAALGALVLAGIVALGQFVTAPGDPHGPAFAPATSQISVAIVVVAALLLCGVAAVLGRIPVVARIVVPIVVAIGLTPFAIALLDGKLDPAFSGTLGWVAWTAVEIGLPLAVLVAFAAGAGAALRKRWMRSATALTLCLALLASAQVGGREAGNRGLPSLTAFEGAATPQSATLLALPLPVASPIPSMASAAPSIASTGTSTIGATAAAGAATTAGPVIAANPPTDCNDSEHVATVGAQMKSGLSQAAGLLGSSGSSVATATAAHDEACGRANAYVAKLTTLRGVLPKTDDDVGELVRSLPSNDPSALDVLVRDNVRLDAYAGILRGPLGTWLGRAGSPADKVALLAAMLKETGAHFTIERGTLSDAEIAKLRALAEAPAAPEAAATPDPALLGALGTSQSDLAAASEKLQQEIDGYLAAGVKISNDTADDLIARLRASGSLAAQDPYADWDEALRPHDWVRLANGTDLDPSAPDLAPGSHLGSAATTQTGGEAIAGTPAATLEFRVIATTARGSATSDATVLDVTHPAYETQGRIVSVEITPPKDTTIEQLAVVSSFTPRFSLDSTTVDGTPIDLHPAGATLRSVRFEIVSAMPGKKPVTFTRVLAEDETDPEVFALHLARAFHVAVQAEPANATLEVRRTLDFAIASRSLIEYASSVRDDAKPAKLSAAPNPYPIDLVEYFERAAALESALARADGVRFAYDRPQIAMLVNGFERHGGKTVAQQRLDIVDNGMAALANDPVAAFRANVARGIADTYVEGQVIDAGTQRSDTPTVFHLAAAQGVPLVVLDGTAARRPDSALDARSAGNLARTFALGQVAIAPARAVATSGTDGYGWWAIDPHTGATVGRMSSGAGQELEEEDVTFYNILNNVLTFINLGWTIARCLTGTKAECHQAICNFAASGALGLAGGAAGGALLGQGLGAAVGGTVLGGMPGPGPGLGSSGCGFAFPA